MAFGEITKQLAQQALGNTITEALEGKPAPVQPETVGGTMLAQIQAMQRALKPEEELVVLYRSGAEAIRVLEFYAPSLQVLVMTGLDQNKNVTRIVSTPESLQLVCKVMRAHAPAKPIRINFITPKPKAD